jgi:hypothetical protein
VGSWSSAPKAPFSIGPWRVDPVKNVLEQRGHRLRIEPKAMRVLVYLAERAGEAVAREEILRVVWDSSAPPPTLSCVKPIERLEVWLRLANDSRSAPPAHAIRNYYMIWEDMPHPSVEDRDARRLKHKRAEELRWVRDFVSHRELTRSTDAITFLMDAKLDRGGKLKYDPTDTDHEKSLGDQCRQARNFIEAEIEGFLTP